MPTVFRNGKVIYEADTCEPLRDAVEAGEIELVALARGDYPGAPMPESWLDGVRTVGYWDAPRSQSWGLDWHRNEGIEFTYVSGGSTAFSADGVSYNLGSDHLTITRPWQSHRVGNPHVGACRLHWLILDVGVRRPSQTWCWPDWLILSPDDLTRLTRLLQHNEHPVWVGNSAIAAIFEAIADAVAQPVSGTLQSRLRLLINGLLVEILDLLDKQWVPLDVELTSTKRNVQLFLQDLRGSAEQFWNLQKMADTCGLGRTQFAKHCRDLTNMSPVEYLQACRIEKAKAMLLKSSEASITDIAAECGFESSQYFSNSFRKLVGCSPREFRHSVLKAA